MDIYGIEWNLPSNELCPVCGQPDSCGDCNHQPLDVNDIAFLKSEISEEEFIRNSPLMK